MGLMNHNPARTTRGNEYDFTIKFDINGTSAPDGVDPAYSADDIAITRASAGVFNITFAARVKPFKLLWPDAKVLGTDPQLRAGVSSYTAATGVLVVRVYREDDTSGVAALAEPDNTVVYVHCKFTKSSQDK